ncbi:MAG TPA: nucleoside-diphosphate kinase [Deltaproteobacteria bacterium]|jgi:nucleoside-diphosphate kinase|nr:nucleoside-diphosphate kinase [Deltaproteobacteria bacterium]HQI00355.1 nucleoside-diphosphate kinase [Deltaproteobacteria bacterium]HQJ09204.1 nucleoside-diphosphate kinase [Deltaproteobacteria bacterium]
MSAENIERSLVLIKPDALKNSLTGYILSQFSEFHTGLRFAGLKVVSVNLELAEEHYAEHYGKFFYPSLLDYIRGYLHYPENPEKRRVIAIVYQGKGAIKTIRDICGPTNPHDARIQRPGCIRALGTVVPLKDEKGEYVGDRVDNLIHASANPEDAEREIKLWFKPTDIPPAMRGFATEVNEEYFYYKDGAVSERYEPGSFCFTAPGHLVWKTDLKVLRQARQGQEPDYPVKAVVAKYLINKEDETA